MKGDNIAIQEHSVPQFYLKNCVGIGQDFPKDILFVLQVSISLSFGFATKEAAADADSQKSRGSQPLAGAFLGFFC